MDLQGSDGSGQRFTDNAETLILIATSHFELHERGYETLLTRTRSLGDAHRTAIALGHATSMGSHLRFGFEATYGRDTIVMRNDNVADYPWLCFALVTLLRECARLAEARATGPEREAIVEAILNGLTRRRAGIRRRAAAVAVIVGSRPHGVSRSCSSSTARR